LAPRGERVPNVSPQGRKREDGDVHKKSRQNGPPAVPRIQPGDELGSVVDPPGRPIKVKNYSRVAFVSDAVCGQAENYATLKAIEEYITAKRAS
jgi:ferredoxin--NADP+ reductase